MKPKLTPRAIGEMVIVALAMFALGSIAYWGLCWITGWSN